MLLLLSLIIALAFNATNAIGGNVAQPGPKKNLSGGVVGGGGGGTGIGTPHYCTGSYVGTGASDITISNTCSSSVKFDCILIHEEGKPPIAGSDIVSGFLWYTEPTTIGGGFNNHPGLATVLGVSPQAPGSVTSNVVGSFTTTMNTAGKQYHYLAWTVGDYIFSGYYTGDGSPTTAQPITIATNNASLKFIWIFAVEVFTAGESSQGPSGGKTSNITGPYTDWYINSNGIVGHGLTLDSPAVGQVAVGGGLNLASRQYYYWAGSNGTSQNISSYTGTNVAQNVSGFSFSPEFTFVVGSGGGQNPPAAGWSSSTDITAGQQDTHFPFGNHVNGGPLGMIRQPSDWPASGIKIDAGGGGGIYNNVTGVQYGVVYFKGE